MKATIVRLEHRETETLGVLLLDGRIFCDTLELPWRQNYESISCIPEGLYRVERKIGPELGEAWHVWDVPQRTGIVLGHVGNTHHDTQGCVLLGLRTGQIDGKRAVLDSTRAVAAWQAATVGVQMMHLHVIGIRLNHWRYAA